MKQPSVREFASCVHTTETAGIRTRDWCAVLVEIGQLI